MAPNDIISSPDNQDELWVFGYGSILWKTGFKYQTKEFGFILGYERRFWQGNTYHRGTPDKPGRVATLVENPMSKVWGAAFQLVGSEMIEAASQHLGMRECTKGGYTVINTEFYSRSHNETTKSIPVLAFYATECNDQYLGSASSEDIASQVVHTQGVCGSNIEYITKLAEYIRAFIPEDDDGHLFSIEEAVEKLLLVKQNLLTSHVINVLNTCANRELEVAGVTA